MTDDQEQFANEVHTEGPDRPVVHRTFSFSLRGLIAVITLLGIVMGLVLPAIAQIREASRRVQCQNNLKQLVLAVHNYESAFKKLPVGIQLVPGRNDLAQSREGNWSWSAFLTPYLEQQAVYDYMNPGVNNCLSDRITASSYGGQLVPPANFQQASSKGTTGSQGVYMQVVMTDMNQVSLACICPSDPASRPENQFRTGVADSIGMNATWPVTGVAFELGRMSYVAANSSRQCYALNANASNGETITEMPDGIFHAIRAPKLRDLRDGQSNIVIFSERISGSQSSGSDRQNFNKIIFAGAATSFGCRGIGNSSIDGSATNNVAGAWGAPDVLFSAWGGINLNDPVNPWRKFQGVSSNHPGGVNIARADGSVEFFSNIDFSANLTEYCDRDRLNVWQKLISVDDARAKEIVIPD